MLVKRRLSLTLLLGSLTVSSVCAALTVASSIPVYRPTIVARLPHDPAAFTEGLELSGGVLYEGTGLEGRSDVRRVNVQTGQVIQSRPPPVDDVFGEGVSLLGQSSQGGRLFQLSWQSGLAFVYDPATLRETGRFRYTGEGWGLTNDGTQLIMSDGSSTLTFRDGRTFAPIRTLKVSADGLPVERLNELEYAGGFIWANVWLTNRIARIDPKTGRVTAWLDVSELSREATADTLRAGRTPTPDDVANGIAFNRTRGTLLLTGKRWPTLYEVRVPGLSAAP